MEENSMCNKLVIPQLASTKTLIHWDFHKLVKNTTTLYALQREITNKTVQLLVKNKNKQKKVLQPVGKYN